MGPWKIDERKREGVIRKYCFRARKKTKGKTENPENTGDRRIPQV